MSNENSKDNIEIESDGTEPSTKENIKNTIKGWFQPIIDFFKNIWHFIKSLYWKAKLIRSTEECDRLEAKWNIENPETGTYTIPQIIKKQSLCDELEILSDVVNCDRVDFGYAVEAKKKGCTEIGKIQYEWEGEGQTGYPHEILIKSKKKCEDLQKLIDYYKNDEEKAKYYQEIHDSSCRECGVIKKEWDDNQYTPYQISKDRKRCKELDKLVECYPKMSKYQLYCTPCGKLHAKWLEKEYTHEQIKKNQKRSCEEVDRLIECANDPEISFDNMKYMKIKSRSCNVCKNMEEDWKENNYYTPEKLKGSQNLCNEVIQLHSDCNTENPEIYEKYYKEICSDCIKNKERWEYNNFTEEDLDKNRDLCKMVDIMKNCEYLGEEHQTKFNDLYDRYCSDCILQDKNWVETKRISYGPEHIYNSDLFCNQLESMKDCNNVDQTHKDIYKDLYNKACTKCGKLITRWKTLNYTDQIIASSDQLCEELDTLYECTDDPKWLEQKQISCSVCGRLDLTWKSKNNYDYDKGLAEKNLCYDLDILTAKKAYEQDGTSEYCELSPEDKATYEEIHTGLECNLCDVYQAELEGKTDEYIIDNNDSTCEKLATLIECDIDKYKYQKLFNKACTSCGKALIELTNNGLNLDVDENNEFKYDKDKLAADIAILNGDLEDGEPKLCGPLYDINNAECENLFNTVSQVDYLKKLYLRGCSDCMDRFNKWISEHGDLKYTDTIPEDQKQGICEKINVLKECDDSIISLPGESIQDQKIEYKKLGILQGC